MTVSGFTFVRNAIRLDYPVVEAITSILPICDEFIVAAGDSDDGTTDLLRAIGDPKVRIIETVWDPRLFVHGAINAQQTDLALDACAGDWAFYLQADEVVHEQDLPLLVECMERYIDAPEVEGFLFDYLHFYGDYRHYQTARNWYRREVRIVRNGIGVRSWRSAQGFRRDGQKLKVVPSGAQIYHYGWVRPPRAMKQKQIALDTLHHDTAWVARRHPDADAPFDYGPLKSLAIFKGTHPAVMRDRIARMDWRVGGAPRRCRRHKHEHLTVRLLTFVEDRILRRRIGEYRNYVLIEPR